MSTTIIENYELCPGNMSRYELIFCTYEDYYYKQRMCSLTWLCRSRGGKTLVWPEGENLYMGYATEKSQINEADLVPILIDVKRRFPGSISALNGVGEYDDNGLWVGCKNVS
jgi:hypothetical protein